METQAATASRNHRRRRVRDRALVRVNGVIQQAIIADIGIGGLRLEHVELEVGDHVKVYIKTSRCGAEPMAVVSGVVRWTVGRRAGIEFAASDERGRAAVARVGIS